MLQLGKSRACLLKSCRNCQRFRKKVLQRRNLKVENYLIKNIFVIFVVVAVVVHVVIVVIIVVSELALLSCDRSAVVIVIAVVVAYREIKGNLSI